MDRLNEIKKKVDTKLNELGLGFIRMDKKRTDTRDHLVLKIDLKKLGAYYKINKERKLKEAVDGIKCYNKLAMLLENAQKAVFLFEAKFDEGQTNKKDLGLAMEWDEFFEDKRDIESLNKIADMFVKLGLKEEGEEVKIRAVFDKSAAYEKAVNLMKSQPDLGCECIKLINEDLWARMDQIFEKKVLEMTE